MGDPAPLRVCTPNSGAAPPAHPKCGAGDAPRALGQGSIHRGAPIPSHTPRTQLPAPKSLRGQCRLSLSRASRALPFAWAWSWLLQPPTCWEGGGRSFCAEMSAQTQRRAQNSLAEPQALREPSVRMGIPSDSAPPARKFSEQQKNSDWRGQSSRVPSWRSRGRGQSVAWPAAGAAAGAAPARTEPSLVCRPRSSPAHPGPRSQTPP